MVQLNLEESNYIVSTKEICAILGLKARRIQQLTDENALVRVSHGKYDLPKSIAAYVSYIENKNKDSDSEIDKYEEEALWTRARREKTELEVKIIKGELHRSQDVERVMNQMLGAFRGKLLAFPTKWAPQVTGKSDIPIVKDLLKNGIRELMNELADYDPNAFYEYSTDKLFLESEEELKNHDNK